MSKDELLAQVLALPEEDRAEFADRLMESLDSYDNYNGTDEALDPEWAAEILRRSDGVHAGTVELVDHETVMREARQRLAEKRKQ